MGVYIKNMSLAAFKKIMELGFKVDDGLLTEVKTPHGKLIDVDTISFYQYGIDQWHKYTDELVVTQDDIEKIEPIIESEME